MMASLDESSKLAGYSAEETAQTYDHLYGVLGDAQSVSTTTANLQAMGLEQGKLQKLTDGAIGAWAKYGDSIPIDGLAEAVNHTVQLGEVQGTLADVIEWGGGSVEDFNAKLANCSSATERADMIMKLFAEQGLTEAGAAWQENNASIVEANKAQAENERIMAEWGEKAEPITTTVQQGFNKILEKLLELVGGVDLEAFGATIDKAFAKFTDEIMPAIVDGLTWIIDNKDIIIAGIAGIGAAFAAFKVVSLIQSVTKAMEGMTVAQWLMNAAMNANPIGLIIAAVAGLVAAFVVLWNKCDAFREFWVNLWEGIKTAAKAVADWFVQAWEDVSNFFIELWDGIKSMLSTFGSWIYDNVIAPVAKFFTDLWHGIVKAYHTVIDPWIEIFKRIAAIVDEKIVTPIREFFTKLWGGIASGLQAAWDKVSGIFLQVAGWVDTNVIQPVANLFSKIWSGLTDGATKAWQGVKDTFSKVASFFGDIFGQAWQKVKGVFSAGGKIFDGIKDGIVKAFKTVVNAIIRGINKVVKLPFEGLNKILDKITGLSIVGVKPFDWLTWRAPVPQLPELATGGVVRKATAAIIGEDGAEAVMPLEKNTGWIKKLAAELAAQQPQGVVVNQTNNYSQAHSRIELYKTKQATAAAVRLAMQGA